MDLYIHLKIILKMNTMNYHLILIARCMHHSVNVAKVRQIKVVYVLHVDVNVNFGKRLWVRDRQGERSCHVEPTRVNKNLILEISALDIIFEYAFVSIFEADLLDGF